MGRPPAQRSSVAVPPAKGGMKGAAKSAMKAPMLDPMQSPSPMDSFDSATPAAAFKRGGTVNGCSPMPKYHPDPGFCGGGSTRRR